MERRDFLSSLPPDVILLIASFTSTRDVGSLFTTCKKLSEMINSNIGSMTVLHLVYSEEFGCIEKAKTKSYLAPLFEENSNWINHLNTLRHTTIGLHPQAITCKSNDRSKKVSSYRFVVWNWKMYGGGDEQQMLINSRPSPPVVKIGPISNPKKALRVRVILENIDRLLENINSMSTAIGHNEGQIIMFICRIYGLKYEWTPVKDMTSEQNGFMTELIDFFVQRENENRLKILIEAFLESECMGADYQRILTQKRRNRNSHGDQCTPKKRMKI